MSLCSHSKQEQLYMLDLYIDTITFFPNKLHEIVKSPEFYIRLKLSDIPEFLIQRNGFKKKTNRTIPKDGILKLAAGKIHVFTKKPSDLLRIIKSESLSLTLHETIEKSDCGEETVENPPICAAKIILPDCQCDQIAMASNEKNLPKPYILTNTYNLVDRDKPAGRIFLSLRIVPLGKSVSMEFLNCDGSFLFKNSGSANEFRCFRIPASIEEVTKKLEYFQDKSCFPEGVVLPEINPSARAQSAVGLTLVCEQLTKKDGGPAEIFLEKKTPVAVVREEKEQKEKIDFSPTTPYCICEGNGNFLKRLTGNKPCGGTGCKGGLCLGSRTLEPFARDYHGGDRSRPCYTGNCCSGSSWRKQESPAGDCRIMRLRGGGGCGCGLDEGGGACIPPIGRITCRPPQEKDLKIKTLFSGLEKKHSSTTTEFTRKRGCGCFDNEEPSSGPKFCSKKPCLGADCLIRAFKETQEFVDSIGRVPGMVGLGLMDPSESPYFGRRKPPNFCPMRKPDSQLAEDTSAPEPSSRMRTSLEAKSPTLLMALNDLPATVVPKSTGISQPNTIFSKAKKKEERVDKPKDQEPVHPVANEEEKGPCKQPTCKSRRKKFPGKGPEVKPNETPVIIGNVRSKHMSPMGGFFSTESKEHRKRLMRRVYGEHRRTYKDSVKVPRRIRRHVRMISRRLPGICYGHRNCLDLRMRVPPNMGWLWNSRSLLGRFRPRLGWRPGAISKYVYELLMEAKAFDNETSIETRASTPKGRSTSRMRSSASIARSQRSKSKDPRGNEVELPPTLHIHRKDGVYYVTMYPIRKGIEESPQLQNTVKPMQFKITKNKDDASGYSSSTASDMEIEFSPPAALTKYRKKPEPVHEETQVTQQEILNATKPVGPKAAGSKKKKRKS